MANIVKGFRRATKIFGGRELFFARGPSARGPWPRRFGRGPSHLAIWGILPSEPMVTLRAVIFDMDGVIVDSEPRHERAFREVFAEMGYAGTHGIEFQAYYGRSDRALWQDFVDRHQPPQPIDELIAWKQRRFLEILREDQPLFADAPGLVADLSASYLLALASGSLHPVIDAVLEMGGLRRFFPVIVSSQDVARGKPAPDIFLRAAERMGVAPGECCVIEDAAAGVEAARAAGMATIAITNSLPADRLARADHVVSSYSEIRALLLDRSRAACRQRPPRGQGISDTSTAGPRGPRGRMSPPAG